MITVNELLRLKCNKKQMLEPLLIILSPFAPHICEELWALSGNKESLNKANYPEFKEEYVMEDSFNYPISINGKLRDTHPFPIDINKEQAEKEVVELPVIKKWIENKNIVKIIFVPKKIINIVTN